MTIEIPPEVIFALCGLYLVKLGVDYLRSALAAKTASELTKRLEDSDYGLRNE